MDQRLSVSELRAAFDAPNSSTRLRTALTAGTYPDDAAIDVLVRQCAIEPDFSVRDMLTWALTRHDRERTVDRVLRELGSTVPQARSQALHTLSKLGDRSVWPRITVELLRDEDDEVARAAWRTAVGLVPDGREAALADTLSTQLGRGGRDVQRSLSRAIAAIGEPARPVVDAAAQSADEQVRAHAMATARMMEDPDAGFDAVIEEAKRIVALG